MKFATKASDRRIGQHPPHLPVQHRRVAQPAALRDVEELVVRNAAPEEERQAGGQIEIGDGVVRIRRDVPRPLLDAVEEARRDQQLPQGPLDPRVEPRIEARRVPAVAVRGQQEVQLRLARRPPIGAPRQRREDLRRAGPLVLRRRRPAREDAPAALGVAGPAGHERPRHGEVREVGTRARLVVEVAAGVGAHRRLHERQTEPGEGVGPRRLGQQLPVLDERRGHLVHARRHGDAHAPVLVEVPPVARLLGGVRSGPEHGPFFGVIVRIRLAGEREPRDRLAVEQDLQLVRLVVARNVVRDVEGQLGPNDVLAVLREVVPDQRAAARAQRQPLEVPLLRKVRRQVIDLDGGRRRRAPDRRAADLARRGQVAVDERRRHPEGGRDVVEPVARVVGREQLRRIDLNGQQVADRVGVLGAVQAMEHRRPAGVGVERGRAVEPGLEPAREPVVRLAIRTRPPHRGHEAGPQLAHHLLPHLGTRRHVVHVQEVQRQAGGLEGLVVAGDAVAVEQRPLWGRSGCRARANLLRVRAGGRLLRARSVELRRQRERQRDGHRQRRRSPDRGYRHRGLQPRGDRDGRVPSPWMARSGTVLVITRQSLGPGRDRRAYVD